MWQLSRQNISRQKKAEFILIRNIYCLKKQLVLVRFKHMTFAFPGVFVTPQAKREREINTKRYLNLNKRSVDVATEPT